MKVGIVGAGRVGSTAGFAMVLRGSCDELVLVDRDDAKATAQAADIAGASPPNHPVKVTAGEYEALGGSDVVVLAAGIPQRVGQDRPELLENTAAIYREIVPLVTAAAPQAVLLVASDPVDVMTDLAVRLAGARWRGRVLGVGTVPDTARFRQAIAARAQVDAQHVHGYVVGEHGSSAVLAWSRADIAGLSLLEHFRARGLEWNTAIRNELADEVKRAAARIVEAKGAVSYAVSVAIARVAEAVLNNSHAILTVSAPSEPYDVCLSLPRIVGQKGVVSTLELPLSQEESLAIEASAESLRQAVARI
jgi:L-lactate dehydrogenase